MPKPNRTTFIALVVLEDAIRKLEASGPLQPPQHGVRLALAYLYSITLTKNRDPFDALWRILTGRDNHAAKVRSTLAGTQFGRICQEIGVKQDIELGAAFARVRQGNAAN